LRIRSPSKRNVAMQDFLQDFRVDHRLGMAIRHTFQQRHSLRFVRVV